MQQLSLLSGLGTPSSAGGMVSGWAAFPWHQPREHPVLGTDVIPLLLEEKVLCGPQMQSLWLQTLSLWSHMVSKGLCPQVAG